MLVIYCFEKDFSDNLFAYQPNCVYKFSSLFFFSFFFYFSLILFDFFFFFSSRRRHTRSLRDWSSDVCSSDLSLVPYIYISRRLRDNRKEQRASKTDALCLRECSSYCSLIPLPKSASNLRRSEERRVGKECRCRWSQYH